MAPAPASIRRSRQPWAWYLAAALCVAFSAGPAAGQAADPTPPGPTPTPTPAAVDTPAAEEVVEAPFEGPPEPPKEPWVKRLRAWAHHTVAGSAAWFDGLFGDVRVDDDVYVSRAWLTGLVSWDEEDGVSPGVRLRARYVFPQMERKLGLLVGRGDADDLLSPADPAGGAIDRLPESERETVAGLEYVPLQGTGSRLSFSAGARIADPIDPYVRGRYRHLFPVGDDGLVRFRQTVFWRDSEGFGTTSAVDVEHRGASGFLVRWSLEGTVSEVSDGMKFDSGVTVYHSLGTRSALAWHGWLAGQSAAPVPTREFGLDLAYRRRLRWPWLIGEVSAGRAWRRERPADERHGVWLAGIAVEMQLGQTP